MNGGGFNNGANNGQAFANSDYTVNTESLAGKPSSYFQNNNTGSATGRAIENTAGAVTAPNTTSYVAQSAYTPSLTYGASNATGYQIQSPSDFAAQPTNQSTNTVPNTTSSAIMEPINRYLASVLPQYTVPNFATKNHSGGNRQEINGMTKDFSIYSTSSLNMGLTAQPGQAHLRELDTGLIRNREIIDSPYSNNILENDCYQSQRFEPFARQVRWNEGEKQGVIYATPETTGTDQPTKYGISQGALDLYRRKFNDIANTYPVNVKDLTEKQAMNLLCQYYKGSRAEAINDPNLAFAHYDSYFNGDKNSVRSWQRTLNELYPMNISVDGVTGSELINAYNSGDITDKQRLYDTYLKHRLQTVRKRAKRGIRNRIETYR